MKYFISVMLCSFLFFVGCSSQQKVDFCEGEDCYQGSPTAQKAVRYAYSQIGTAYRSGGKSPTQGFDCSGLVYWAYRANGVKIPRVSTDQARAGQEVPPEKAGPGDIVVFKTGQGPRGYHSGMYAGQGKFIHSPRPGASVRTDSISAPYWRQRLVAVRRVSQ